MIKFYTFISTVIISMIIFCGTTSNVLYFVSILEAAGVACKKLMQKLIRVDNTSPLEYVNLYTLALKEKKRPVGPLMYVTMYRLTLFPNFLPIITLTNIYFSAL